MKSLFTNFIKFSGFYLLVTIGLHFLLSYCLPLSYYWGSDQYVQHLSEFEKTASVNTLFYGSSRTASHIIPSVFDEMNSNHCANTISYNFGIPGIGNPEYYYLYENFIQDNNNIKYAFFELTQVKVFDLNVLKMDRTNYWLSFDILRNSINQILNENHSFKTKCYRFGSYIYSYGYKVLSLSKLFHFFSNKERVIDETLISGYKPLPEWDKNKSKERIEKELSKYLKISIEEDSPSNNQSAYIEQLLKIIDISNKKGIKVFFIVCPRELDYSFQNEIKSTFPERTIDLSNGKQFPHFYSIENSYDLGHLNQKGAKFYTEFLATEFITRTCTN